MAGLTIKVSYNPSVTALQTSNPTLYAQYTAAIQTAVQYFQNLIATPISVNISFGWGETGGTPISAGSGGTSSTYQYTTTYAALYNQVKAVETTSPVQIAAVKSLPTTDPTGGATFTIATAEAQTLGFDTTGYTIGGAVGLNSSMPWSWSQSTIAPGTQDAVGVLEHEISEVLGRSDEGGKNNQYTLLDMFRYTAADGLSTDPAGAAAGPRDQPFVAGYNSQAPSYFSYSGTTVTQLYETPANVASGADVADWAPPVPNDSFADSDSTGAQVVTPSDIQEMNVLGYQLAGATVAATTVNPRAANLLPGSTVAITVNMSRAVIVAGGTPTLSLNDNGTAIYNPLASSSTALVYDYTVAPGQSTSALAITGENADGSTIEDATGTNADLTGADDIFGGVGVNEARNDFAQNGVSDVLWHSAANGDTGYWLASPNGTVTGFEDFGNGNTAYSIAGVGYFDDTGIPEVLWHDSATGDTGYWTTDTDGIADLGGAVAAFADFGNGNTAYSIAGVGDFTGSGTDNVLWHNPTTGDTGYWTTNSSGAVTGFQDLGTGNTAYSVVGVGDFTDSGTDDVLWHNAATGDTGYWITNPGGQVTGFHDFGAGNTSYTIAGLGEFDSSGAPEILWHDSANGDTGYWTTNSSGQVTGFHDFGDGNTAYQIATVGDYTSNGTDSVLWRNPTTGDTGYWITNSAGQVTGFHDYGAGNTSYAIVPG